jgi:hypothetical protein
MGIEVVLIIITDKTHARQEHSFHKSNEPVFAAISRHISRTMVSGVFEWTYLHATCEEVKCIIMEE